MVTTLIYPEMIDFAIIRQIVKCNLGLFVVLFGAMVVSSAFTHLNSTTAFAMLVVYIIELMRQAYVYHNS